ncbi:hypothetical protein FHS19_007048 [Paenibacillus rhizosphaerae]|uniref:Uncharacterized protein n=1 Tax=Paenibacillus rhizosphaerae TaxID=297318 RepID=A0A839TZK1_9BACL|nr:MULTISPECIES: hypothetical protein [Paenibacillus]MBB3132305.1 hypothetical protein [Paenibacillus rhizosphaerae]OZB89971.1 hypothetical protein CJP46_35990 [Paenibacillus sp. XY044]
MNFYLDDFDQKAIRIALVSQIQKYEDIFSNSTNESEKEYWARELERSKNAFKKISGGETIEEYRRTSEESKK